VFENKVLRRGRGGRLQKCIITVIKSRMMRQARHVARMKETRNAYSVLVGKPEG